MADEEGNANKYIWVIVALSCLARAINPLMFDNFSQGMILFTISGILAVIFFKWVIDGETKFRRSDIYAMIFFAFFTISVFPSNFSDVSMYIAVFVIVLISWMNDFKILKKYPHVWYLNIFITPLLGYEIIRYVGGFDYLVLTQLSDMAVTPTYLSVFITAFVSNVGQDLLLLCFLISILVMFPILYCTYLKFKSRDHRKLFYWVLAGFIPLIYSYFIRGTILPSYILPSLPAYAFLWAEGVYEIQDTFNKPIFKKIASTIAIGALFALDLIIVWVM